MIDFVPVGPGNIFSLLLGSAKPVMLLGAGASKTSGIPLAGEITEKVIREAYCREKGIPIDWPQVLRSDWIPWVKGLDWYNSERTATENYPIVIDKLLRPQQIRRDFFLRLINPEGIDPSSGYISLAHLMKEKYLLTVLTTNFDNCLIHAANNIRSIINQIKTPSDYTQFSLNPTFAQQVFLHGSVEHYSDQNITEEVQALSIDVVEYIRPLLRDCPVVVVGYRGGEPSIMQNLFIDNIPYTNNYRHGIYWCLLKSEDPRNCPPLVLDLARKAGNNFRFIHIDSFDHLIEKDLWQKIKDTPEVFANRNVLANHTSNLTFDTKVVSQTEDLDLEWPLIHDRIAEYSSRLDIHIPINLETERLKQEIVHRNLAVLANGKLMLTIAGCLLFTSSPQRHFAHANISILFNGPESWQRQFLSSGMDEEMLGDEKFNRVITGNLWRQLNEIIEILALVNRPFRLKGESSEAIYPYSPLAIKEIVVNALVHRDYSAPSEITIEVTPDYLRITNPGGLIEDVKRQFSSESIENEIIRFGRRGIKGYRNPVIADLFYGSGAMDKAGSGLSDVYRWMNENGGTVTFGPTKDNQEFVVTLYRRPEEVDEVTKTASPITVSSSRYSANIFELVHPPKKVWFSDTSIKTYRELWRLTEGKWEPPLLLYKDKIWTFFDLNQYNNPLKPLIDNGNIESLGIEEFIELEGGKLFAQLVNKSLEEHFNALGLRTDGKRHRAYFPSANDDGVRSARSHSYQARFKRATRTVAKPRVSSTTGKTIYWEHQSITFHFQKIGSAWGLFINPGYVFTLDGWKKLLAPEKVTLLSIKKSSRDYNMAVLNGLIFWSRFISENTDANYFELLPNWKRFKDQNLNLNYPQITFSVNLPTTIIHDVSIGFEFTETAENENMIREAEEELENLATGLSDELSQPDFED